MKDNNDELKQLSLKIPQWAVVLIKRTILVISWSYIFYRFAYDKSFKISNLFNTSIDSFLYLQFILVLLLVIVNWNLESYKWKLSISEFYKISLLNSFKGVLFGLSVAIFTPNRTGEYLGRIWAIPSAYRIKSTVAIVFTNTLQLSVTLIFGIVALFFWNKRFVLPFQIDINKINHIFLIFILFIFIVLVLLIIILRYRKWLRRTIIQPIQEFISHWSVLLTIKIWLLSALRYMVFIVQFWLLLKIFNAPVPIFEAFLGIGIMYLVMAILPILTLAEPAVRTTLSVAFLSVFQSNEVGIISASLAMWVFNLAIPSIIGTIMLNSIKTKQYD